MDKTARRINHSCHVLTSGYLRLSYIDTNYAFEKLGSVFLGDGFNMRCGRRHAGSCSAAQVVCEMSDTLVPEWLVQIGLILSNIIPNGFEVPGGTKLAVVLPD
jgi:hypothetical protein